LAELACIGCPALIVPYPYAANNHQELNAGVFAAANAAVVIDDSECNGDNLSDNIVALIKDKQKLEQMSLNALALGKPEALTKIGKIAAKLVRKHKR
jgi:UDP-N-acetylglucosamine--N-acetylmuramyl-(pentapeptide) pyrophosphoryl-undecaprenol N-acetylglucosamine transferase